MTSPFSTILKKPCLIDPIDGVVVIEPMQFISARSCYAKGRYFEKRSKLADFKGHHSFHNQGNTQ
jgi:hypothetical protein